MIQSATVSFPQPGPVPLTPIVLIRAFSLRIVIRGCCLSLISDRSGLIWINEPLIACAGALTSFSDIILSPLHTGFQLNMIVQHVSSGTKCKLKNLGSAIFVVHRGRLNRGAVCEVKTGDTIEFVNTDGSSKIKVRVIRRMNYPTFKRMLVVEGLNKCLPVEAGVTVYQKYYTEEEKSTPYCGDAIALSQTQQQYLIPV